MTPLKRPASLFELWHPWGRLLLISLTATVFALAAVFSQFPGDEWALLQLQTLQSPWLTNVGTFLSIIGGAKAAVTVTVLAVVLLWLVDRRADSLVALLGGLFIIAGILLKLVVERPRPEYFLLASGPSLSSFPSGHTVFAAIFCGVAIVLTKNWIHRPILRRGLQIGLVLLILVMGASRVYLGFHWPSDVLGAYLYSAIVLGELIWLRSRLVIRLSN